VIDYHRVASEIEIAHKDYVAACYFAHRRAFLGGEVHAVMGRARQSVQDALAAVNARHGTPRRAMERSSKPSPLRIDHANPRHLFGFARDACQDVWRRRNHFLG
jgi:hypothetical protein